jgi:hypothetical protein
MLAASFILSIYNRFYSVFIKAIANFEFDPF